MPSKVASLGRFQFGDTNSDFKIEWERGCISVAEHLPSAGKAKCSNP
jgi:hypothetical protein